MIEFKGIAVALSVYIHDNSQYNGGYRWY